MSHWSLNHNHASKQWDSLIQKLRHSSKHQWGLFFWLVMKSTLQHQAGMMYIRKSLVLILFLFNSISISGEKILHLRWSPKLHIFLLQILNTKGMHFPSLLTSYCFLYSLSFLFLCIYYKSSCNLPEFWQSNADFFLFFFFLISEKYLNTSFPFPKI